MEPEAFHKKIWLSSPTMHGEEQGYVRDAFATNWVSTVGENINELEKGICAYLRCRSSVALSSGTAALHLAVKLAGVRSGDRVFCSSMTFAATVNPVLYEGGEPVLIDSEYDTWNMDPAALERAFALYPDTKAVIVVDLYGVPAKLEEICRICERHRVVLIEDAAEALSATYKGRPAGTFGKYNVLSFNGNKIITTSGGGMLCSDREADIAKARFWSTQAREDFPWYQHKEVGYNYRLSNILAGIGRGQLCHLEEHRKLKKEIYLRYKEGLKGLPVKMNPYLKETEPNFWLSCLVIESEVVKGTSQRWKQTTPEDIRNRLAEFNIEARPIWKPMHLQPLYKDKIFISAEEGGDVGGDIFARGLCLPSDIKMTESEQEKVVQVIKDCFA